MFTGILLKNVPYKLATNFETHDSSTLHKAIFFAINEDFL